MKKLLPVLMVLVALVLMYASGGPSHELNKIRESDQMDIGVKMESLSPGVAFVTIALGGFRGILADMLWMRSERLKEEGSHYELLQLGDLVTKLEPRMAEVWSFHGWNMAYNVSVTYKEPEERWRWVQNGFKLLRDEGLKHNPYDPTIHRELGWIFQHKIGNDFDNAHNYYKRAWHTEMSAIFTDPNGKANYDLPPDDPSWATLKVVYKMDRELMQEIDEEYGPLDWRLPNSQAIYWAYRGKTHAKGFKHKQMVSMIYRAMADQLTRGETILLEGIPFALERPDLSVLPRALKSLAQAKEQHGDVQHIKTAEKNFMELGVVTLDSYGREKEARELFETLSETYPEVIPQGVDDPFESLIYREQKGFFGSAPSKQQAEAYVGSTFFQAYLWEDMGDADRANGLMIRAKRFCQQYMKDKLSNEEWKNRVGIDCDEIQKISREEVKRYYSQYRKPAKVKPKEEE